MTTSRKLRKSISRICGKEEFIVWYADTKDGIATYETKTLAVDRSYRSHCAVYNEGFKTYEEAVEFFEANKGEIWW